MKKIILLAILAYVAALSFNYVHNSVYPSNIEQELKIVPQPQLLRFLCVDHEGFFADLLFTQVVIHAGSLMWKPLSISFDSNWSYKMVDLVTDLDPKFYRVYIYAAMGLIHNFDDVKLAKPILEKGMKTFPDSWELPFWIGYDHYVYFMDYQTASKYLWQAHQKPNAPKTFLGVMLSAFQKSGDYAKATIALQILHDSTKDKNSKRVYAKKIMRLKNLTKLQKLALQFKKMTGSYPNHLKNLVDQHLIDKIPQDPYLKPYVWNDKKKLVVLKK